MCGDNLDKKINLGFPNGCETAVLGHSTDLSKMKASRKKPLQILCGISRTNEIRFLNCDWLLLWASFFPQVQPIILSKFNTIPDWNFPRKISFHEIFKEKDNKSKDLLKILFKNIFIKNQNKDDSLQIVFFFIILYKNIVFI